MGEENPFENNRVKSSSKFSDENQVSKGSKPFNNNSSKSRSLWGSQIVKGFSSSERKTTKFTLTNKKEPLTITHSNQKINQTTTVKRTKSSLVSDLSCSVNATKVHPQQHQQQRRNHQSNHVFVEIDQLRSLLLESKEREAKLQVELSDCRKNQKVVELELKRNEIDSLVRKVDLLEVAVVALSATDNQKGH